MKNEDLIKIHERVIEAASTRFARIPLQIRPGEFVNDFDYHLGSGSGLLAKIDNVTFQTEVQIPMDDANDILVDKFKVSRHKKPYPAFGGKHFVLTPGNDPYAREAIVNYANAISCRYPKRSKALLRWIEDIWAAENTAIEEGRELGASNARREFRKSRRLA